MGCEDLLCYRWLWRWRKGLQAKRGSKSDSPELESQSLIRSKIFRRYFFIRELKIKASVQQGYRGR